MWKCTKTFKFGLLYYYMLMGGGISVLEKTKIFEQNICFRGRMKNYIRKVNFLLEIFQNAGNLASAIQSSPEHDLI